MTKITDFKIRCFLALLNDDTNFQRLSEAQQSIQAAV